GVIRYWLQRLGHALPSRSHMERIDREVLKAKPGAKPRLKIGLYVIHRDKDELKVSQQTVSVRLNF
ncbi:MAG TPA: TilS substrate-binding domain-containing protein, partial [Gammaproteobacteria bacterium]|nr:TilS substrate-binding domain-containing protein [Gammaproteobacteria bacterium]